MEKYCPFLYTHTHTGPMAKTPLWVLSFFLDRNTLMSDCDEDIKAFQSSFSINISFTDYTILHILAKS